MNKWSTEISPAFRAVPPAGNDILDIGLTSDNMAGHKDREIPDYPTRKTNLLNYLKELGIPDHRYQIQMLTDPYGTTLEGDYDSIVVLPRDLPRGPEDQRAQEGIRQAGDKDLKDRVCHGR
jgi:phosphopantetheine adenylyltransferase